MAIRFETQQDVDREVKAIDALCSKYGFTYEKLGKWDLDFRIFRNRKFIGYVEVKGRNKDIVNAYSLPLAQRKYKKMMIEEGHKVIIWACYDGIIYGDLSKLLYVERQGGRKPREGSANDVEMMHYYVDQVNLNTIKYDTTNSLTY